MLKLNKNKIIEVTFDYLIWVSSTFLAVVLRYDGSLPATSQIRILQLGTLGAILFITIGTFFSIYSQRYQKGSIEELLIFSIIIAIVTLITFSIRLIFIFPNLPRSTPIVSGLIALVFILAVRFIYNRNILELYASNSSDLTTIIYGAGQTGRKLFESMIRGNNYNPVGFIDDDPQKSNLKIFRRPVLGRIEDLEKIVKKFQVKILIISINDIEFETLLSIDHRCKSLQIKMMVAPSAFNIYSGLSEINELHELSTEDILGRKPFEINDIDVFSFLNNKRVLVTGAAGSIGSEIVRQINLINPNALYMLDRDENALNSLHLKIRGNGLIKDESIILADIRDAENIDKIFDKIKPEIVFHAAALKHLNILEIYPLEAFKTNVLGTKNILEASKKYGVKKFINISTDKAVNPTSVLGESKFITERLTAGMNLQNDLNSSVFISVRFGNVIGSNGSFVNAFKHQISNGGPVTVTHPEIDRYFMTIGEAVHLVLQAAVIGNAGETLILDMGNPIKIDLIAKRMILASGKEIKIVYTGLQKGEKLHESLSNTDEILNVSAHKRIFYTKVKPMKLNEIVYEQK
jgi:FlaA1/EpsC-like NDP-sugar epimerase